MKNVVCLRMDIKKENGEEKSVWIDGKEWKLYGSIDGIDSVGVEYVQAQRVKQNGSVVTGRRLTERDVTFSAVYRGTDKQKARLEMVSNLNPLNDFTLFVTYNGVTRRIPCKLYKSAIPAINIHRPLTVTATFICPDPLFTSETDNLKVLGEVKGRLGFPYVSIFGKGFISGAVEPLKDIKIINDGDATTGYITTFKASGSVINPVLICNGKLFAISITMQPGDVLVIDFTEPVPRVVLNGVNVIQYIERTSDLGSLELSQGENQIGYDAQSGAENLLMSIRYYLRYVGV